MAHRILLVAIILFNSLTAFGQQKIPFIPDPPAAIFGLNHVCPGAATQYSITPSSGAGFYIWSAPNGASIEGSFNNPDTIDAPDGWDAFIQFGTTGGQVCVVAGSADGVSAPTCISVTNTPIPSTILPKAIVCAEEAPYILPWGEQVNSSGTYSQTLTSWLGCDSIVKQTVTILQPIVKNRGSLFVCQGDCISIAGEDICGDGPFLVFALSYLGCDSIITGQLVHVVANAVITPANPSLNCMSGTALLSAAQQANFGTFVWKNSQWQTIGTSKNITVNTAGTYHLIASNTLASATCRDTATVTVAGFSGVPLVIINQLPPSVPDCNNPQTILAANSNIQGVVYSWGTTTGFVSMLQNPIVTQSGTYTVTVTSTATGCTGTASTTVISENQYDTVTVKICPGETYGAYSQPGNYADTLETFPCGCHRIRTLHLEETNLKISEVSVSICPGATYSSYSQSGTYLDTFNISTGCDSLRVLHLSVLTHVSISVTTKSDNGSGIGSISLGFNGGLPPYRVHWSNGDTLAAIDHLISGFYFVEVSDAAGCAYGYLVKVPFELDSIPPIGPLSVIDLYPNPAQTSVILKTPEDFQGSVYFVNQLGQTKKIVNISKHTMMEEISADLSGMPAGIYMVVFEMPEQGRVVRRLWVEGRR
ncbi:MAG: T9SS type A sorting domain-containing protein [Bacteroidota bacterium]